MQYSVLSQFHKRDLAHVHMQNSVPSPRFTTLTHHRFVHVSTITRGSVENWIGVMWSVSDLTCDILPLQSSRLNSNPVLPADSFQLCRWNKEVGAHPNHFTSQEFHLWYSDPRLIQTDFPRRIASNCAVF